MSMAFERLCLMVLLMNPIAVELSTCIGVGGCSWPISWRAVRIGTASLAARNVAPTSASIADDMTALMIFARTWTAPLSGGVLVGISPGCWGMSLRKNIAPARLLALFSERYEASLAVQRTMSLLW